MGAMRLASGIFSAVSSSVGSFSNLVLHRRLRQRLTDRRVISAVCEPVFVYVHCIIFLMRDEGVEKYFEAGRVAPPSVVAFGA